MRLAIILITVTLRITRRDIEALVSA